MLFQGASAVGLTALNPIMTALFLRYGSKILTDPKVLKSFTEVYEDAVKFPTKDPLTKSRRNDILQWAAGVLPTEAELEEQDFIKQIDQSILSLIENPQSKLEQNAARDKQIELMTDRPKGTDFETMKNIQERITPDTFEQRFYDTEFEPDVSLQPNIQGAQLTPQTRSNLAFGTLDEALESQMMNRGIGTL